MLLPALLAFTAAVVYAAATIAQALGVKRMRAPVAGARAQGIALYGTGIALDGVGFVTQAAAATRLPLFFVQAVVASSVAITALMAVVVLKNRLARADVLALAVVAAGLIALAVTAAEGPAHNVPTAVPHTLLLGVISAVVALLWGWRTRAAWLMAVASGLGFSGVAIAARIIDWHTLSVQHPASALHSVALWALVLDALVAMIGYGMALDAGRATTVAAINFGVETVIPAGVGLVALGDQVRSGTWPVAALGFVLTVGGCIALARHSEPDASVEQLDTPAGETVPGAK